MHPAKPARRPASLAALLLAALLHLAAPALAQTVTPETKPAASGVGAVTHLSGTLTVRRTDGSTRFLSVRSNIVEGDTLITAPSTYARMKFADGGEVVLRPESQLEVKSYRYEEKKPENDNVLVSLLKGGLRSVTGLIGKRNREKVLVTAPNATIGIRGTHFGMLLCQGDCGSIQMPGGGAPANGLHVDVLDGAVTVRNNAGAQNLNAGQFGYVRDASTPPTQVPPQQGVQVTMPLAISRNPGSTAAQTKGGECPAP